MDLSEARDALIDLRRRIDHLIAELGPDVADQGRSWRNYDTPATDPAEIEARWGVDTTEPAGEAPEWFQSRFGMLYIPEEPPA